MQCLTCGVSLDKEDHLAECFVRKVVEEANSTVFKLPETKSITITTGPGRSVVLHPDGSFLLDGELVNADDKNRGKRLFSGMCELMGLPAPALEPAPARTWSAPVQAPGVAPGERMIEVWCEGFSATGQSGPATFWGSTLARDFPEACKKLAVQKPKFKDYFDPEHMTWWGCRLYDNATDARRSFG